MGVIKARGFSIATSVIAAAVARGREEVAIAGSGVVGGLVPMQHMGRTRARKGLREASDVWHMPRQCCAALLDRSPSQLLAS